MSLSAKKFWNEYGAGGALLLLAVLYGLYALFAHLWAKGAAGEEAMGAARPAAYGDSRPPAAAQESQVAGPAPAHGGGGGMALPAACGAGQNPADLLPRDANGQWAQLNPAGKGALADVNLLKAGYHIGIDTVGQTLRNANMQIRSEPPNPQINVGPWNMSTIESDFMRPPLEVGQGTQ
jgi:hypothetical protein